MQNLIKIIVIYVLLAWPSYAQAPDGCGDHYAELRPPTPNDKLPNITNIRSFFDPNEHTRYVIVTVDHGNNKTNTWFERSGAKYEITITYWQYDCGVTDAPLAWAMREYLNGDLSAFTHYGDNDFAHITDQLNEYRSYRWHLMGINK